ncbi:MAG: 4-(cytidine 5'-diphospho)-2-C-methyl-D-erythritol kinase [Candidatus Rokubacteria bacterium RIFCSPLOWO2_12_FULL_71_19]|nr:MAG: 4-(cytidine 5'-diphospho)-2-C-methyl-D-erythritol kinase [Candidatus Rokubacteria bacterium RIFCSPLOWO2_12_FULL_71_19]
MLRTLAKVNLALEVLGKRDDGYHEIATVMQGVDLSDRLTLETADALSLHVSDPALPAGDDNLIVRAAAMLREAAGAPLGARIALEKRIPVAAGLGGGSSDAAATLWGLNRLWGLRWSRARLAALAVRLGMDVPFFLGTGRALATGRGERLKPLPGAGGYALVLVNPNFPLSTREVYGRVPAGWTAEARGTRRMVEALRTRSARAVAGALTNNLEAIVEPMVPAIRQMKSALLAAGALGAVMSGSGPTVFGVARSYDHARQIRRRVNRAGWSCWAVRTVSGAVIRAL